MHSRKQNPILTAIVCCIFHFVHSYTCKQMFSIQSYDIKVCLPINFLSLRLCASCKSKSLLATSDYQGVLFLVVSQGCEVSPQLQLYKLICPSTFLYHCSHLQKSMISHIKFINQSIRTTQGMTIITISNGSAHHGYGNKQEKCIKSFKMSTRNFHTLSR